ncbi:farnesyl-diphosphate synthase /geranylgeranyl-diphosphate synthase [Olsenella sp. KH3B4]|uniref:polyprenyl synthetase family protein n=1 Tax=Olsenella sp. KH3B4 TaxID=1855394 RepID=UPI0008ADEAB4|nr:polyprenyl synthetase family protein [Olsenella sp. KH3B4]SES76832.1 farnesyl-diphosphate synthase /geranylgeranyl-diphosphate synthase [Olsenella sp. KH3B4]
MAASSTMGTGDGGKLFASWLAERRPRIEDYISAHLPAPAAGQGAAADLSCYLYTPLARFTRSGGKRTRPALVLLGCEAVGGDVSRALSSAAAIEDFQSAALIHDDIADEGEMRRGQPCVHRTEGVGVAVNVGDLGIVRTFAGVLEDGSLDGATKLRVLEEFAQMEQRTVEGQALDLGWARDERWDVTVSDYLTMATHKTAFYSAASPLSIGAICGGGTDEQVEALGSFGMDAGLAFQLQDDLLNLVGDAETQGKDFRSDITEGKRTMVVCWALEHLTGAEKNELLGILSSHATDARSLSRAVSLMEKAGAIDAVRSYARGLAESAKGHLDGIELAGDARAILDSMADFFVERRG